MSWHGTPHDWWNRLGWWFYGRVECAAQRLEQSATRRGADHVSAYLQRHPELLAQYQDEKR